MNLLNRISIKTRMLALVLLPLFFAAFLSALEIQKQSNNVRALNTLNSKITFLESFSALNIKINQARERLYAQGNAFVLADFTPIVAEFPTLLAKAFTAKNTDDIQAWFNSTKEALTESPELTKESVIDWSTWMSELQEQALIVLEKDRLDVPEQINQNLTILFQLQWLSL